MPEPVEPSGPVRRRPAAPEHSVAPLKFTRKELESKNHEQNAVIIIDNVVYDVTEFLAEHPGGHTVLLDNAGRDASACFHEVGHSDLAFEWRKQYVIGEVVDADKWEVKLPPPPPLPEPEGERSLRQIVELIVTPLAAVLLIVFIYKMLFE